MEPKPIKVPLKPLLKRLNPFRDNPWTAFNSCITKREIEKAIQQRRFQKNHRFCREVRREHIERIAFLVSQMDISPIEIDVGAPELDKNYDGVIITDGWHRLAAAIYCQNETILANISGSLEYARQILGVDCAQCGPRE